MVEYGMSEMESIVSSTKIGAEAIGIGDQIGTIEKGKLGDIIIVKENPLKNIKILQNVNNINMVIKNGEIVINRK